MSAFEFNSLFHILQKSLFRVSLKKILSLFSMKSLVKVGTGRFRRRHKYHDKNVDSVWISDNGYMVSVSTGSKFVKIWKVEQCEGCLEKTDVTELQILREHSDYLSVIAVHKDTVFSASGDQNIYLHRYTSLSDFS